MNICRKCKNRMGKTIFHYYSDYTFSEIVDYCLVKPLRDPSINPVTGEKIEGYYEECRFLNRKGECQNFIKKPFWRFW